MAARKKTRFSDYFQLNKNQAQLDFIDVPIETDIPLYVDPYALHVSSVDWLRECGNNVVEYFELLIAKIRKHEQREVLQLLDNFHEPNETHLGLSSGRPAGRGWGRGQATDLLNVLKSSAVIKTGTLNDLGDYEMFIPGIGPDKISDLATNIIKSDLILYTQEQCLLLGIPTQSINSGKCWHPGTKRFLSSYVDLPICPSGPVILVPKTAVRTRLIPSRDSFYSSFVLDYLEAELISASDSLVQVLKNGTKKVFRKDLKEKFPLTHQRLYEFSLKHPEVLKNYKKTLPNEAKPITDLDIEWRQQEQRSVDTSNLSDEFAVIKPGRADASKYHNAILGILTAAFYPMLSRPVKEKGVDEGRKRIDINFTNTADDGFFAHLVNRHKFFAPYISVECKNYREDPENPELDQLQGRFSKKRGNVGILVCRSLDNPELMLKKCRDVVHNTEGIIIVLTDDDVRALLHLKNTEGPKGVSSYMQNKLDAILT